MSCLICNVKVSRGDLLKIKCDLCDNLFHPGCVSMNEDDIKYLRSEKKLWHCSVCIQQSKTSRMNNKQPASPFGKQHVSPIRQIVAAPTVLNDLSDTVTIQKVYDEVCKLNNWSLEKNTEMEARIDKLFIVMSKLEQLLDENKYLKLKLNNMEERLEAAEQQLQSNSLDIVGLENTDEENVLETVIKLANNGLDLQIDSRDIDFAYRKRRTNGDYSNVIHVKFVYRRIRTSFLEAGRKHRNLSSSLCGFKGNQRVYINESLSFSKRQLFSMAKKIKSEKNYKYLWIRNSKILMKKIDGGVAVVIKNVSDLDKL